MNTNTRTASLEIRRLTLASLKPHPRNPRVHPAPGSSAWEALKKSLEFDYFDPIVLNTRNGLLVSGHLRTKVLIDAGFKEADCVIVDYPEDVHVARMIAANRNQGQDDLAQLGDLLRELDSASFEMDLTGYDSPSLAAIAPFVGEKLANSEQSNHPDGSTAHTGSGKSQRYISVGRHRVPLTDDEFALLSARFEAYEKETGTRYGFVNSLLTQPKRKRPTSRTESGTATTNTRA